MDNIQKRSLIEALIGGVLAAMVTLACTHGNIPAAIVTFVLSVPSGYCGGCIRLRRQAKKNAR